MAYDANRFSLCVYSYLHQQQFNFFSSQKCQSMHRMSTEHRHRTVGLTEGGPDPDFDPR